MKKNIVIKGLDCAACAAELEEELKKIDGVNDCSVSFVNQRITVDCDGEEALNKVKDTANHFEEVRVVEIPEGKGKAIKLRIKGLDCAACAAELEEELKKIDGVNDCSVSFVNQSITVDCDGEEALNKVKDTANHFEEVKVVEIPEGKGKVIKLKNLHCANCAQVLQERIEKAEGVNGVIVDFVAQNMIIDGDEKAVERAKNIANHFEKVKVVEDGDDSEKSERRLEIIRIIVSAVFLCAGVIVNLLLAEKALAFQIIAYVLLGISYLSVGYPVLISTVKNIAKGRIFDENFLMTLASLVAIGMREVTEGVAVMLLYQIGEFLQGVAVGSSRKSIVAIMDLKSESATLLKDGEQVKVKPEELKAGDVILVKAGEKIPVDGKILKGKTSLDTKSLTGESALKEVEEDDEILSGCINAGGVIEMEALREYSDSAVAKILDLVENSSAQKAKPEKFITKFAKYYTPIVCGIALFIAVAIPLILGAVNGGGYGGYFKSWIQTALILLVISCPCALIISVPLTYFGGIGAAAKYGVLVKGATYLDDVTKVKTVAFDKTGTLTEGCFNIVNVIAEDKDETLKLAAALEKCSSHPLAGPLAAIDTPYVAENAEEVAGRGISADVNGKKTLCGNAKLLRENGVEFKEINGVSTVVYVAGDGKYLGCVEIDDKIKDGAEEALKDLHSLGVEKLVMLTGDNEARAKSVARELDIDEVKAGLLPDEKLSEAQSLKEEAKSKYAGELMYVGDGINDAPVMAASDCAVSMGKIGSAAAIEASDIVLVSDSLKALGYCFRIAKKTRRIVLQNIIFSIVMKVAFMVMGIVIPSFPLPLAVFGDVGVMLIAVLNSLRIRTKIN